MSTVQTHEKEDTKDLVHKANPEYPFALYEPKTGKAKGAKDKEEYDKLTGQGYTEDPPKHSVEQLSPEELSALKMVAEKGAVLVKVFEKLGQMAQQQNQPQTQPATTQQPPPPAPSKGK
jgi:hypothetical protein